MKIKVSNATDIQLNYLVAIAEGGTDFWHDTVATYWITLYGEKRALSGGWAQSFTPSTESSEATSIIEREKISTRFNCKQANVWEAYIWTPSQHDLSEADCNEHTTFGLTQKVAAMRCYVTSKLGDEVEVPDELV